VDNSKTNDEFQPIKKEVNVVKDKNMKKRKPEDNEDVHDDGEDDGDGFWIIHGSSKKQQKNRMLRRIPMRRLNHVNYRTNVGTFPQLKTFMKRQMNRLKR